MRIAHRVTGSSTGRPPMLLTHGYSASAQMWDENVPALARERVVVTWDLPGHGESETPDDPGAYTHETCLTEIERLLDELGAEPAVLCGQSLGGFLSLSYTLAHPARVAALVLVDSGPGFRDDAARERWNEDARNRSDGPVHGLLLQHDSTVFDGLVDVSVPTLIVVGSEDELFLPASEVMESRISGARRLVLDGAGHMANVDAPVQFNLAVSEFLEEL